MAEAAQDTQSEQILRTWHHDLSGHIMVFSFPVCNLAVEETWTLRENFETECEEAPSSWLCNMEFRKVPEDGQISIPFSLRRTDSATNPLKVHVQLSLGDEMAKLNFASKLLPITREEICGGNTIENIFSIYLPLSEERERFNQKVIVSIRIQILDCHTET